MAEMPGFSPPTRGVLLLQCGNVNTALPFPCPRGGDPKYKALCGKESIFSPPTRG